MDHAIRLLTLQFVIHLHAILGSTSFYILDDHKLLEWNAVKKLHFTAPSLCPVFASLSHEFAELLHIERPAMERLRIVELDDEEYAVCSLATPTDARLSLNDHHTLLYRAKASRLVYVQSSFVKKRKA